jgi:hypothetical protein
MADAFEEFQARVRANLRMHCEADLYWRTNRWESEQETAIRCSNACSNSRDGSSTEPTRNEAPAVQ